MPPRDKVTPAIRETVMVRDGQCVAALLDRSHQCRDQWGTPHSPYRLASMTLEHVKSEPMMGVRSPSDPEHLVAMCHSGNVIELWGSKNRDLLRAYLAGVRAQRSIAA